ncbi:hypothetical protein ACIBSW_18705 [Actinoplanes sp. NPDC049668]|uniref:hypothetical protein n=1 Tax=unclassified Actinoplanes TaxID=2626549 RepID=UPI0033B276B6
MSASTSALLVAFVAAGLSLTSAAFVEVSRRRSAREMANLQLEQSRFNAELADTLLRKREADNKTAEARRLVARYRDPLLISSFDLQSRIFNVMRPDGFRGGRHPDYYRSNTLFVIAEFFGWLEIIRRDLQFLDLGAAEDTRQLLKRIEGVRDAFASTSKWHDDFYIYRGEQRAIGELMAMDPGATGPATRAECMGYASFVAKLEEPGFARWFDRTGKAIGALPGQRPERLVYVQNALVDLIDFLDPGSERLTNRRNRLSPDA